MKTTLPLFIIFFCFILLHHELAFADNLRLCGVVQQTDRAKGTVTIEVLSSSCPGSQTFKLAKAQTGTSLDVNEKKCFFIDSAQCADTLVHTIVYVEGE